MTSIRRTYPQPDGPSPNFGPRERALAVFKYLLDLEPEVAVKHPLFACIVHAFVQCETRVLRPDVALEPSLVPMLTSERQVDLTVQHVEDPGL